MAASVWLCLFLAIAGLALVSVAPSAIGAETRSSEVVITNPVQLWEMAVEARAQSYPLHIETRINYYDPVFGLLFVQNDGVPSYIQMARPPPVMKQGQRVLIEGRIVPIKGLSADLATVKVLKEYEPIVPLDMNGRTEDIATFGVRVVTVDAYVDGQQLIDPDHLRLYFVAGDKLLIGWMKPDDPKVIPDLQGSFVRVQGLYSGRFDPTGSQLSVELWIGRQSDITVLGTLTNHPKFSIPQTPIKELYQKPNGTETKVRGEVQSHDPGYSITIRDSSGQVLVKSAQRQRIAAGTEVEVIGRVGRDGNRFILESALYRKTRSELLVDSASPKRGKVLETVAEVRSLSTKEASLGRPVSIVGMITWSLPETDFFFLQDLTGGLRVKYDSAKMGHLPLCKYIKLEGVTYDGGFTPALEMRSYTDLGAMTAPPAKPVTYNQAITGREDGQWVEMRGFVQRVESDHDWRWVYVTTPEGEFVALLQSPVNFVANPGSLIRVHGSCEVVSDREGKSTGVMLRVPFLHDFTIDEDAPADYYDLPLRSIQNLEQLYLDRSMTRARISGVVLHVVPGHYAIVQDNTAGIIVFTRATESLTPGDSVEVVGILGVEGFRTVLREGVYRKLHSGMPPVPAALDDLSHVSKALDSRLVSTVGILIDELRKGDDVRLTLQSGSVIYEAFLDHQRYPDFVSPPKGAELRLTGIYKTEIDDSRQLRGFKIQLRSPQDLVVLHQPRLWTLSRALAAAAVLGVCMLLSIIWGTTLRRRVRKQTEQIREQMDHQARLEAGVQHASRLESLGALAGGIAHDFNNILTIVMGNLGLAMQNKNAVDEVGENLREAQKGVNRARELTKQLLTFAKGGSPIRAAASLPELVQDIVKAVLAGSSVRCEYKIDPDLWSANIDKSQIAQALQNLLLNSIQAMPSGGVIKITLTNDEIGVGKYPGLQGGRYVKLSISDSGMGISPEIKSRIFDPYFTTKGAATGLGLSTVYSIIKKHQGVIEVDSEPGTGATFHLWLPAIDSLPTPIPQIPASGSDASSAITKSARVLLLDDEESIRKIAGIVLRKMGMEVTVASEGSEALRYFKEAHQSGKPFELLILDLTIHGGMGGKAVIEAVRKIDLTVPAILSSGYSNDPVMAEYKKYGFQAMVPKPYEIDELEKTVKDLLTSDS